MDNHGGSNRTVEGFFEQDDIYHVKVTHTGEIETYPISRENGQYFYSTGDAAYGTQERNYFTVEETSRYLGFKKLMESNPQLRANSLPGHEEDGTDVNHGYAIIRSVEFQDGRGGFVIGCNPEAVQPFVTWKYDWEIKDDEPYRSYDWGHYTDRLEKAEIDFSRRVDDELAAGREIRVSGSSEKSVNAMSAEKLYVKYCNIVAERAGQYAVSSATLHKDEAAARLDCDQIVKRVMNDLLLEAGGEEHYPLYTQYMDNLNFKARLEDYAFAKAYLEPKNAAQEAKHSIMDDLKEKQAIVAGRPSVQKAKHQPVL